MRGAGFTFDDTSKRALPLRAMDEAIAKNPKNAEMIRPYIGGEEVAREDQAARLLRESDEVFERLLVATPGQAMDAAVARQALVATAREQRFEDERGEAFLDENVHRATSWFCVAACTQTQHAPGRELPSSRWLAVRAMRGAGST